MVDVGLVVAEEFDDEEHEVEIMGAVEVDVVVVESTALLDVAESITGIGGKSRASFVC